MKKIHWVHRNATNIASILVDVYNFRSGIGCAEGFLALYDRQDLQRILYYALVNRRMARLENRKIVRKRRILFYIPKDTKIQQRLERLNRMYNLLLVCKDIRKFTAFFVGFW